MLILNWGSRTGEIVNLVNLNIKWERDIVTDKFETGIPVQMLNVPFGACKKVISTNYLIPFLKKPINKMRSKKSSPTGN